MDRVSISDGIPINIPNSLTVLRILLVPVFVGLLVYEHYDHALLVLIIAAITDGLDGAIARMANQQTRIGAYLDPLADKLLLMSSFLTLAILHLVPVWAVIMVVSRDVILLSGTLLARLTESSIDITPTALGKGTTLVQFVYITMVVLMTTGYVQDHTIQPVLGLMATLTVASGTHYLYRGIKSLNYQD
ncbi:MAG: CDP-alcohol phosphatidyltransferase family protein [Nitrospirales bacterium]|nr:CDP-alcohol phosphatidyltransferase family protein [Nitrospira sp.]MDR4500450.1 CDP-alcohol phosphatidyltransferase family protein [Nitrospirales bacterium]